jgi:hypothetical protein
MTFFIYAGARRATRGPRRTAQRLAEDVSVLIVQWTAYQSVFSGKYTGQRGVW